MFIILISCAETEARRPKKHGTQNFYKDIVQKNKRLNELELKKIEFFLSKDTINEYLSSSSGFWYTYKKRDASKKKLPKKEDIVDIEYDITSLDGEVLYEKERRAYRVDKEDFIPALQDGIKLMKKGETITFVIPSFRAYGVTGDGDKIGISQPIKSTVTVIDIKNK